MSLFGLGVGGRGSGGVGFILNCDLFCGGCGVLRSVEC